MDERTKVSTGAALLIVGAAVVFLYALPSTVVGVPALVAVIATLGMAAGTWLVGTSGGTV